MIDTIKLTLDKSMYWITDSSAFHRGKINAGKGYAVLVQNPTKTELKSGLYKPRLTLTNRFNMTGRSEETLSVELSLPKLLYGNNFDELQNADFETVAISLQRRLSEMGVRVFLDLLKKAPVSSIHYSKNIPFTDGNTSHFVISKIKNANIKLALDVNQTDYRNDGHAYKWHCNSYEVAFYDKLKDLKIAGVSEKRSLEKDNVIQHSIFDEYSRTQPFEVLRMEVRLNNRQKIKQVFNKLEFNSNLVFEELYDSNISQKILLYYLDELESKRPKLLDYKFINTKELLSDIILNNPKIGVTKTFQIFGIIKIMEEVDLRELRAMFNRYNKRSWYRLIAQANDIKLPNQRSPFVAVRTCLSDYKPLKLVDFQEVLLNNDKYK